MFLNPTASIDDEAVKAALRDPKGKPTEAERETQCAGCMSGSCSLELAACDSDNSCECVRRCHATPQPLMHADLWCPKVCHGRSRIYNAQVACMDAHCADVCSQ